MIHLNFSIDYPFIRSSFNHIFNYVCGTPFKNKFFEFEVYQDCEYLLHFNFDWRRKCDHAGVRFALGLFGYEIMLCVYDNRHWDYKTDNWEVYENQSTR